MEVRSVHKERFNFRNRTQMDGESVYDFVCALKKLAVSCHYPHTFCSELVRDQLIFGLKSTAVREQIFFDEKLRTASLEHVAQLAINGENFQKARFGNMNPLEKEEIQGLIGPYMDESSLLAMHNVSRSCSRLAMGQWSSTQNRNDRRSKWSLVPISENPNLFDEFVLLTDGLKFSTTSEMDIFMRSFSNNGGRDRWPITSDGVVQFSIDRDNLLIQRERQRHEANARFYDTAFRFLDRFGDQISVLVLTWSSWEHPPPTNAIQNMLRRTPSLRELWIKGCFPAVNEDNVIRRMEPAWPPLPILDSLHCDYGVSVSWDIGSLIFAYGSQLTSLSMNYFVIPAIRMDEPLPFLLQLTNIEDLNINTSLQHTQRLGECTEWKIKRLSISRQLKYDDEFEFGEQTRKFEEFIPYVEDCESILWNFLNRTSGTLEELCLNIDNWDEVFQYFFLPVMWRNREGGNIPLVQCNRVNTLLIPYMYTMSQVVLIRILNIKFPRLEYLRLANWDSKTEFIHSYYLFVERSRTHDVNDCFFPGWTLELFNGEIDPVANVPFEQLSSESFSQLWNGLPSLRRITVLDAEHRVFYRN